MLAATLQPPRQPGRDLSLELFRDRYYDLPVHNLGHPLGFRTTGRRLLALCRSHGDNADGEIVDHIAMSHDTDLPFPLDYSVYSCVEERSADIAYTRELAVAHREEEPSLWLPTVKIIPVVCGVLSTHFNRPARTLEQKISNRADVDNTGQRYEKDMAPVSFGLFVETRHLAPVPVSFEDWQKGAMMVLGGFVAKKLSLGDFDVNTEGILWETAQAANYKRFCGETEESLREIVGRSRCEALEYKYPPTKGWEKFHLMTCSV